MDGYVRLRRTGPQLFGTLEGRDSLLFVDVDDGADVASLRDVPHAYVTSARMLLFRTTQQAAEIPDLLRRFDLVGRGGLLRQPVGASASIEWSPSDGEPSPPDDAARLARARRIEMRALLGWGGAVWTARTHHYLLPSGLHANAFVKAGHAIGEPRDAEVIASWMLDRFDATTPTALVIDTGTLSAVALALKVKAGELLGDVVILEKYPATDVDVERVVDSASRSGRIAGLISVCSSGGLRDRLWRVFKHLAPRPLSWSIDALIDLKDGQPQEGTTRSWVVLPRDDREVVVESQTGECKLCRDHKRAVLVPIDPHTFDAYLPTLQEREMPDVLDADRNQHLWEACTRTASLQVEATPDAHVQAARRTNETLSIKLDLSAFSDVDLLKHAGDRLTTIWKESVDLQETDLVLVSEADAARPAFSGIWDSLLSPRIADAATWKSLPTTDWSDELKETIRSSRRLMIFALGSVTGGSLQKYLTAIQRYRRGLGTDYTLSGLVLHARPEHQREWETLANAYGKRLFYAWRSYLPSWSPLKCYEARLMMANATTRTMAIVAVWPDQHAG